MKDWKKLPIWLRVAVIFAFIGVIYELLLHLCPSFSCGVVVTYFGPLIPLWLIEQKIGIKDIFTESAFGAFALDVILLFIIGSLIGGLIHLLFKNRR